MSSAAAPRFEPMEGSTDVDPEVFDAIVVGAGWTGLATAAALRAFGVHRYVLLEAGEEVGSFWRCFTYDRIKLHTPWHGLPCLRLGRWGFLEHS